MILLENSISFLYIIYFFHRFCLIFTDCLFFLILLIRIIYKYSGQEDLRQKRKATVLFPLKQYSSFSLYLFKAFRPKTSLFGEGMWESNPPRTLLTPHTGFEDQEAHRHLSAPSESIAEIGSFVNHSLWVRNLCLIPY